MIHTVATFVVSALLGVAIPLCALIVQGQVTLAVMRPEPPPWALEHLSLSLDAIELFAWLSPVLVSVLIIRSVARAPALAFGIVAGLFAIGALVVAVTTARVELSLADAASFFWRQALLLIVFLPIACVVPFKRVG